MRRCDVPAEPFEEHLAHLRAVAYRMLGSLTEADDAVQEAWLRMERTDIDDARNMRGWVTAVRGMRGWVRTVGAPICVDLLRARSAHAEQPLEDADAVAADSVDPEAEAV